MINAEFCAWCNKQLKGKKSFFFGLCSKCRMSKEGQKYIRELPKELDANPIQGEKK